MNCKGRGYTLPQDSDEEVICLCTQTGYENYNEVLEEAGEIVPSASIEADLAKKAIGYDTTEDFVNATLDSEIDEATIRRIFAKELEQKKARTDRLIKEVGRKLDRLIEIIGDKV
jgi:hypothetical protein